MKFLQIHSFYPHYLRSFYAARPGLATQSYELQFDVLLSDGFTASHLYAPPLARLGYDARLLIGNCEPLQRAWLAENSSSSFGGHWLYDVTRKQVEAYRPDVLYISDPITFDSRFVRSLSYRPHVVYGWRAAEFPAWVDMTSFDLILSNEQGCMRQAESHGARATQHFRPGFPEWIASQVSMEPKSYDAVFCGQITPLHTRRIELLNRLAQYADKTHAFAPHLFIRSGLEHEALCGGSYTHPALWGLDMHRAVKRGKVCINSVIDFAKGEAGNMRQFEVTGTGSFLLTESNPTLAQQFEPGREVETYQSFEELVEKISYYLTHDNEREAIARRGQERCLKDHGMTTRSQELFGIAQSRLSGSAPRRTVTKIVEDQSPDGSDSSPSALLSRAAQALQADRVAESYKLILSAQTISETCPFLLYLRALCLLKLDRFPDAVEDLTEELKRYPDNQPAHDLLQQVIAALHAAS